MEIRKREDRLELDFLNVLQRKEARQNEEDRVKNKQMEQELNARLTMYTSGTHITHMWCLFFSVY